MGYFYAIAAAMTRGLVYAIDQKILDKIPPHILLLLHSIFSVIILLPIIFIKSGSIKEIKNIDRNSKKYIILTLIFSLIANLLIYNAIQHLGAAKASIFEIAYPLFVVLFSALLFGSSINLYFALGAILIFVGVTMIIKLG